MSRKRTEDWRNSSTGLGLVLGAGVGAIVGLLVAGGTGLALGVAFGGGGGLVLGAIGRSLFESRDQQTRAQ